MTTVDRRAAAPTQAREDRRRDLAALLERELTDLSDSTSLVEELGLDSMTMLRVLMWLEGQGVAADPDQLRAARVGDLLALIERTVVRGVSIRITGVPGLPPPGILDATKPRPGGSTLAPALEGPAFRLVPISVDDINFLYTLSVDPLTCFRWRYRGAPPPVDQFVQELWTQVLVQFVVRRKKDNQPVGHVVCYGAEPNRRHAYVGAVFLPEYMGSGAGARVVIMFIRYLFHTFPFTKVYMEIPGFNWPLMRSGEGRLFHVEGILREHEFYGGQTWDKYLCAVYRDGRHPDDDRPREFSSGETFT